MGVWISGAGFRTRDTARAEEGHDINMWGQLRDIILNVYAANKRALKYVKEKLIGLKREMDKSQITAGNRNTPFFVNNGMGKMRKKSCKIRSQKIRL